MKLVLTSDWHGSLPDDLPEGDVLLVAGDIFPVIDHSPEAQQEFASVELPEYLAGLCYQTIILVAGNHDFFCQDYPASWFSHLPKNVTYLQDDPAILAKDGLHTNGLDPDGLRIWGTPWCNKFGGWAFMDIDSNLEKIYAQIPPGQDVIVTHGPPYMACDRNMEGEPCGSLALRDWIVANQPKLVVTGHIHEAYGSTKIKDTDVFNVSRMNRRYEPVNRAVTYEL